MNTVTREAEKTADATRKSENSANARARRTAGATKNARKSHIVLRSPAIRSRKRKRRKS